MTTAHACWRHVRTIIAASVFLGASACTTQPTVPAIAGQLISAAPILSQQGQIGIKLNAWQDTPAKGISLAFFLQTQGNQGQLDLMTPLGSQMAQVRWHADSAWLKDTNGERSYPDLATLSQEILGEVIPLQALTSWLQGQPAPQWPSSPLPAGEAGFTQLGWQVQTNTLADGRLMATRAESASQRGVTIKITLDR